MKLTRKHINQLFDVEGSDGSWVYQLVDIKKSRLLFYGFDNTYTHMSNNHHDWVPFKPKPFKESWIQMGWEEGRKY